LNSNCGGSFDPPLMTHSGATAGILLLQPHGFEGLGVVTEAIDSNDQAITKCVNVGHLERDLDALSPAREPALDRDDSAVRSLIVLLDSTVTVSQTSVLVSQNCSPHRAHGSGFASPDPQWRGKAQSRDADTAEQRRSHPGCAFAECGPSRDPTPRQTRASSSLSRTPHALSADGPHRCQVRRTARGAGPLRLGTCSDDDELLGTEFADCFLGFLLGSSAAVVQADDRGAHRAQGSRVPQPSPRRG